MGEVGQFLIKVLNDYGALGLLSFLSILSSVYLFRQNTKLHMDNAELHEKRIGDALQYAHQHAEMVAKLESTAASLLAVAETMRDIQRHGR
jgi:hypothetical protein